MSTEEAQALGHPEFWDERYAKTDADKPTHEWFRTFDALELFFTKHLFASKNVEAQPRILHLGSGESVSVPLLVSEKVARCLQSFFTQTRSHFLSILCTICSSCTWRHMATSNPPTKLSLSRLTLLFYTFVSLKTCTILYPCLSYISAHVRQHKTDQLLDHSIRPTFTRLHEPTMRRLLIHCCRSHEATAFRQATGGVESG
jgi:hypothetical protein